MLWTAGGARAQPNLRLPKPGGPARSPAGRPRTLPLRLPAAGPVVWLTPAALSPDLGTAQGAPGLTGELSGDQARKSHSKPWAFFESRR